MSRWLVCSDEIASDVADCEQRVAQASGDGANPSAEPAAAPRLPLLELMAVSSAVLVMIGFLVLQGIPVPALWITLLAVAASRHALRKRGHDIVLVQEDHALLPHARAR